MEVVVLLHSIQEATKLAGVDAHAFQQLAVEAGLHGSCPGPLRATFSSAERTSRVQQIAP